MSARRHRVVALAVTTAVVVVGCSKNAGISAERYIVDELQEPIGLGPLDPECGQPEAYEAGETFTCTATAEDGTVVEFAGTMTATDTFDLTTTNVLSPEAVVRIRERVAEAVGEQVGAEVAADDITCPDGAILLDDGDFECEITDVVTGDVYSIVLSTGGLDADGNLRRLDFQIGDEPLR